MPRPSRKRRAGLAPEQHQPTIADHTNLTSWSWTMSLDTLQDLLVQQLKDLYSAEHQITKALPKMAKAASNETLAQAFRTHLAETEDQIGRLEQVFETLEVSPRGKKCVGMVGLLEEGAETMSEDGEDLVIDAGLIADAQRVEHYEIAAYGTAKALATLLGHHRIVKLLDQTLKEEMATDQTLTRIAEREVNPQAAQTDAEAGAMDSGADGQRGEGAEGMENEAGQQSERSQRGRTGGSSRNQTERQRQQARSR
jgi:ferritin-like metal-binding protein YciE